MCIDSVTMSASRRPIWKLFYSRDRREFMIRNTGHDGPDFHLRLCSLSHIHLAILAFEHFPIYGAFITSTNADDSKTSILPFSSSSSSMDLKTATHTKVNYHERFFLTPAKDNENFRSKEDHTKYWSIIENLFISLYVLDIICRFIFLQ